MSALPFIILLDVVLLAWSEADFCPSDRSGDSPSGDCCMKKRRSDGFRDSSIGFGGGGGDVGDCGMSCTCEGGFDSDVLVTSNAAAVGMSMSAGAGKGGNK